MGKKKESSGGVEVDPTGWMLTFSDLITLLLTFFVMLLIMRSMDTAAIKTMFQSAGKGGGVGALLFSESKSPVNMMPDLGRQDEKIAVTYQMLEKLVDEGVNADTDEKLGSSKSSVSIMENDEGFVLNLQADILFDLGQSDIKPAMYPVLDRIAELIKMVSNDVVILGHTDNIAPGRTKFSSNWELSLYRALSVHGYFINVKKIDPERFATGGCGDSRPLTRSDTLDGRQNNRRVEIILKKDSD